MSTYTFWPTMAFCPLLCCAAMLPAEEFLAREVRLGLVAMPTTLSYTTSDPLASRSGDDALEQAYALGVRAAWSWSGAGRSWAPIVAAEVLAERATYGGSGSWEQYVARGLAGCGWAINDTWSLQGLALIGVGRPTFVFPMASGTTFSTTGASGSVGVLAGVSYALTAAWTLGLEVGWVQETAKLSGNDLDLTIDRSGFTAGIGLAWNWSSEAVRLE